MSKSNVQLVTFVVPALFLARAAAQSGEILPLVRKLVELRKAKRAAKQPFNKVAQMAGPLDESIGAVERELECIRRGEESGWAEYVAACDAARWAWQWVADRLRPASSRYPAAVREVQLTEAQNAAEAAEHAHDAAVANYFAQSPDEAELVGAFMEFWRARAGTTHKKHTDWLGGAHLAMTPYWAQCAAGTMELVVVGSVCPKKGAEDELGLILSGVGMTLDPIDGLSPDVAKRYEEWRGPEALLSAAGYELVEVARDIENDDDVCPDAIKLRSYTRPSDWDSRRVVANVPIVHDCPDGGFRSVSRRHSRGGSYLLREVWGRTAKLAKARYREFRCRTFGIAAEGC